MQLPINYNLQFAIKDQLTRMRIERATSVPRYHAQTFARKENNQKYDNHESPAYHHQNCAGSD